MPVRNAATAALMLAAAAVAAPAHAASAVKTAEPTPTKVTAPAGVVFPKAVDPKFAGESPSNARMHTCLAQYKADKANNTLGGLKWIQKGGGYYSICNARLKH